MDKSILAVGGSPRVGGNSDKLIAAAVKGMTEAAKAKVVHLRDYTFHSCVGCEACRKAKTCVKHNDGMTLLYPLIDRAQGLLLASPAHNYNITAWMKAFIDRLYPYYNFADERPGPWSSRLAGQGRKAALIAVCEEPDDSGMGFTLEAMRRPLEALGYEIVGEQPVYGVFKRGRVAELADIIDQAEALGRKLEESLANNAKPELS